ncbi:hypothetical protein G7K_0447-t1 [Saitoella complicata NRRL Y-17804]|uniref:Uncharacterized protein n=1 Tax=Saitoella complicata (strain BCRC 22490 / CBS 7301 / JCM 7358 / NBRC 10748 / NRRL Y-17804) TaxID=698492 RepID=A0A0E9N8I4_SAICN|nr:hypothetical protein G7K_0447-t1 [Saitoella complicata NRRL Y-17804]
MMSELICSRDGIIRLLTGRADIETVFADKGFNETQSTSRNYFKTRKYIGTAINDSQNQAVEHVTEHCQQREEIIDAFEATRNLLAAKEEEGETEGLADVRQMSDETTMKLKTAIGLPWTQATRSCWVFFNRKD